MLIELRIQNYAVIERLSVRLEPGLNVLSGETGAGKSIIVGALSLLLGERAKSDVVRAGADRALIEGVFDVDGREEALALMSEQGLEPEDGLLILRRQVAAEGRNRAWVNGSPSTVGLVGALGRQLVDLHGQHEHQTLLRADDQRAILDAFGESTAAAAAVRETHERLRSLREQLDTLERRRRETQQRADFLRFQADEIESADLEEDEAERLAEEGRKLEHSEDLARLSGRLNRELYAAEDALVARLGELRRVLDDLVEIDSGQDDARELLRTAYYNLEELGRRMGDYASRVEHDPGRLEEIRERQDLLFRLKSKYGDTLTDVIETGRRARAELDTLESAEFERQELEQAAAETEARLEERARRLSSLREQAVERLSREVTAMLPDLGMADGRFEAVLTPLDAIGAHGAETVQFRVAVNLGFETRPLSRVASGGELSRIMLALKTILARLDRIPSLVFDEIDAGIGGRVAHRIGEKLQQVAELHQVFVITHLAQIACRARHHVRVEKTDEGEITRVHLTELRGDDRIRELARMLGGDPESATSLEHARELVAAKAG